MSDLSELESWFVKRPVWLQDAARRIISTKNLKDKDYRELADLCKKEAGIKEKGLDKLKPQGITPGTLNKKTTSPSPFILKSISVIKGINALSPRKPLSLGNSPLTIIYGRNGSGKSGYVRALKSATGAKSLGPLHGNVYSTNEINQSCTFTCSFDEEDKLFNWNPSDGIIDELQPIQIYDGSCGRVYVTEENEMAYEPWILSFFQSLTNICDTVRQILYDDLSKLSSQKPSIPQNFKNSVSFNWYESLSDKTTKQNVEVKCSWSESDETKLIKNQKRLGEPDPAEKAKLIRKQGGHLNTLINEIELITESMSDEKCVEYLRLKADLDAKKKAAEDAANILFKDATLEGVGSATWKMLWEAAREYSEELAYKQIEFPNTSDIAVCVLCQQPLAKQAQKRLISFQEYVASDVEKKFKESKRKLKEFEEQLAELPDNDNLILKIDSSGITDESDIEEIKICVEMLRVRKDTMLNSVEINDIFPLPEESIVEKLKNMNDERKAEAKDLDRDSKSQNRDALEKKTTELEARKWLSEQKVSIIAELNRLYEVKKYEQAIGYTTTTPLSSKASRIADSIVTPAYQRRFQDNLALLGASNLKLKLEKTRAEKSQVYHRIVLENCVRDVCSSEILSEGEFRIVSIAAFLADVTTINDKSPFVFDDPISSLDQPYEEATVERLVTLCKERQVIVFTHRLSMLSMLQEVAKAHNVPASIIFIERRPWGSGEPVDEPINTMKPKKALNKLKDQRLSKAKKDYESGNIEDYEIGVKDICSQFRIVLERIVEKEMLNEVVLRFRRSVTTDNRIQALSIISEDDCRLIDDMMRKYSRYEHSQSDETPIQVPEPDSLESDLTTLIEWRNDFEQRRNALTQ